MRREVRVRKATMSGLVLALGLAACGGPTEFVPTPTTALPAIPTAVAPATTSTLPVGVARRPLAVEGSPIVASYDDGMPADAIASIEETLPFARQDLGDSGALVVHMYATLDAYLAAHPEAGRRRAQEDVDAGLSASATPGAIWIYGPNYVPRDDKTRRMVVFHEYFHTVQYSLSNRQSTKGPLWLQEGTARYFEYRLGGQHGYGNFDLLRRSEIAHSRTLDPLQTYENRGQATSRGGGGEAYNMGFLAADYLVNTKGLDTVATKVWTELRTKDWPAAFASAFGEPLDQFYADFEVYRRSL
jgi:hypothetical protein